MLLSFSSGNSCFLLFFYSGRGQGPGQGQPATSPGGGVSAGVRRRGSFSWLDTCRAEPPAHQVHDPCFDLSVSEEPTSQGGTSEYILSRWRPEQVLKQCESMCERRHPDYIWSGGGICGVVLQGHELGAGQTVAGVEGVWCWKKCCVVFSWAFCETGQEELRCSFVYNLGMFSMHKEQPCAAEWCNTAM